MSEIIDLTAAERRMQGAVDSVRSNFATIRTGRANPSLLDRIVDDTLLDAIADGTFGLMKRPADGGRGLDGVARKARDYYNPATELLEADR